MVNRQSDFSAFESFLGSSWNGVFSYDNILSLDQNETYPKELMDKLNEWKLYDFFIPEERGGKLKKIEDLLFLMRLLARRDLTTAIAYGGTFLGAVTVWIGGTVEQKEIVANDIKSKKRIAFALTEKDRGGDLLNIDVNAFFNREADQYELSGEKWLYNHASKGNFTTILAKTDAGTGARSCSLFYTPTLGELSQADAATLKSLTRIHTVGLKGLDLGGLSLTKHPVGKKALIGKLGQGLELSLTGLQVTKTLCAGLALGSLDTIFRTMVKFCRERILYQQAIGNIPVVRSKLANAFLDAVICECFCTTVCRASQVFPNQLGLLSALVKAFVPSLVEFQTKELSSLLGARSYINSEGEHRIFQKQARDNCIISIFEGNTYVNYQYVLQQMKVIFSILSDKQANSQELANVYKLGVPIPSISFEKLSVVGKGSDELAFGLDFMLSELLADTDTKVSKRDLKIIVRDIRYLINRFNVLRSKFLKDNPLVKNAFAIQTSVFDYAYRYAKLHAITSTACIIYFNRHHINPALRWEIILKACLRKMAGELEGKTVLPDRGEEDHVLEFVGHCYENSLLFSLFPFEVK